MFKTIIVSLTFCLFFISTSVFSESYYYSKRLLTAQAFANSYNQTLKIAGTNDDVGNRALGLLDIYYKSEKKLTFALAIAHLSLAIERTSHSMQNTKKPASDRQSKIIKGWIEWGKELRKINRTMYLNFATAFHFLNEIYSKNLDVPTFNKIEPMLIGTELNKKDFLPIFHRLRTLFELSSDKWLLYRGHFTAKLVKWEHLIHIQPKMEKKFKELGWLWRSSINNIPGAWIESIFLKPIMGVDTGYRLGCFPKGTPTIRPKNFMNSSERVSNAIKFYTVLRDLDWDPDMKCFENGYYLQNFPPMFFDNPKEYVSFKIKEILGNNSNYFKWVVKQVSLLKSDFLFGLPPLNVSLSERHRIHLDLDFLSPIYRNRYITKTYHKLGTKLSSCMQESNLGNWYHFGKWASHSAGKMIDGSFFKEMNLGKKFIYTVGEHYGFSHRKVFIRRMFAAINWTIGLEMISLGEEFHSLFCVNGSRDIHKFINRISPEGIHTDLAKAFFYYYKAINEEDENLRVEYISLASTLQVMHEQTRVDRAIKTSLGASDGVKRLKLESWYKLVTAREGSLKIGRLVVPLVEDASGLSMNDHLIEIDLSRYKSEHFFYGVYLNKESLRFKNTSVTDWANLYQRKRFLVALFRGYINHQELLLRVH